jgi:hypothetical protein
MKKLLYIFVLLVVSLSTKAQDKIIQTSGEVIKCKIVEVGTSEIKYIPSDNPSGPAYSIAREKVAKIEFDNGKKEEVNGKSNDWKDEELYRGQLKKAIKINLFSPLYGSSDITYEKTNKVGNSFEITFGIIGAGKSDIISSYYYNGTTTVTEEIKRNQFGFFASYGHKFIKQPTFTYGASKLTHILQGKYIRPVFYLGNYSENVMAYKGSNSFVTKERQNVTFAAVQLEFGKQWIFNDKVLLDSYVGIGYGADNKKQNYYSTQYSNNSDAGSAFNYSVARTGKSPGLAFSFGIKIGMLIK